MGINHGYRIWVASCDNSNSVRMDCSPVAPRLLYFTLYQRQFSNSAVQQIKKLLALRPCFGRR